MTVRRYSCLMLCLMCFAVAGVLLTNFTFAYEVAKTQDIDLVTDILLGPGMELTPEKGDTYGNDAQIGTFSNLYTEVVSFTNGLLLSTGDIGDGFSLTNEVSDAQGVAFSGSSGDSDIENLFSRIEDSYDAAHVILHVIPQNRTINIPFLFASEEYFLEADTYDEPDSYDISDAFAFFLSEGIRTGNFTSNIATLPNGETIATTTVNQHTNQQFFVANVQTNSTGDLIFPTTNPIPLPMEYNGAIAGLSAVATNVVPGNTYSIKIVLVDDFDRLYDSSIFLQEKGITSGADLKLTVDADPAAIAVGGDSTYTVRLENIGPVTAQDVVVTNWFPSGANLTASDPSRGDVADIGGGKYVWTVGVLTNGFSETLTLEGNFPDAGSYTNIAEVYTYTGDYNPENNRDEGEVVVSSGIPLTITVNDASRAYGAPDPSFGFADFSGQLVGGDAMEDITGGAGLAGDVDYTLEVTDINSPPGIYADEIGIDPASLDGGSVGNYDITIVRGALDVTERPLEITAASDSKVYDGTALTNGGYSITGGSLAAGDALDAVAVSGSQTEVGSSANEPSAAVVLDGGGADATANYAISYVDGELTVTEGQPDIALIAMRWELNMATGLFEGILTAKNAGDAAIPADFDYWFELDVHDEWHLWEPTGEMPNSKTYLDLTATVRSALQNTGNGNAVWDSGEEIKAGRIEVYHLRRIHPSKYIAPSECFVSGRLFQYADADRNFVIDDQELASILEEWENGDIEHQTLLEADRLEDGQAYLWKSEPGNWIVLEIDERKN
jgi:uncharacterized repeat protein (TIGR01451 family)